MISERPNQIASSEISPEDTERAAVISSFPSFLETGRKLKMEEIEDEDEILAAYRDVTEFQFLITHYVISQAENASGLKEMWRQLKEISRSKNEDQNFSMFQRGVVTQVATHRIFKELGFNPRISHPDEDAFKKIDMWSDGNRAVQIKGSAHEAFGIYETDEVGPAPVEISEDGKTRKLFDSQIRSFRTKLKSFGNDVKGYFIVIPSDKLDFTTGEPSRALIELVKQKIVPQGMKKAA
jgi:hypothetical protein